jgi:predicted nucleotidyltransferase
MRIATKASLNELYRATVREFAKRLTERYGGDVRSIVLYGSVARGQATEASDIDVLVLRNDTSPDRDQMIEISEAIDFENGYKTFVLATSMTALKLQELLRGEFPIARHVLAEGVVLYDDGTFEGIRREAPTAG